MRKYLLLLTLLCSLPMISQSTIQWQKSIGGSNYDLGRNIVATSDGGYIIGLYSNSTDGDILESLGNYDIIIMKLNSIGTIEWKKTYGGSGTDTLNAIRATADGGYIVTGTSSSIDGQVTGNHGFSDLWIFKITSTGILEWQKSLGGSSYDTGCVTLQTEDGGYIVGGNTSSINGDVTGNHNPVGQSGNQDYWVVKLTSTGNILWQKCYGSFSSESMRSMALTSDGGCIINGETQQNGGDVTGFHAGEWFDYWVVKISGTGVLQWQKCLGGTDWDSGTSVIQDSDGNYIAIGYTSSTDGDVTNSLGFGDAWVVKLNSVGNIIWQKSLGGSLPDFLFHVTQSADGGYLLAGDSNSSDGHTTGNQGELDYWVLKLDNAGNVIWNRTLGGSMEETAVCVLEAADGTYTVSGYTSSTNGDVTGNHGQRDMWIVNLSNDLSVIENRPSQLFSLYPNPTDDSIHLSIDASLIGTSYTIYDQLSKMVQTGKLTTENTILNLDGLSSGIYVLNLGGENKKIAKN